MIVSYAVLQNDFEMLPTNAQIVLNGRRIYLNEVTIDNEGVYQCRVRNSAGESIKNFALTVLGMHLRSVGDSFDSLNCCSSSKTINNAF